MPWEQVNKVELGGALTLSGLLIVFAALVILILAVLAMGKVLGVQPKAKPPASPAPVQSKQAPAAPAPAAAPVPAPAATQQAIEAEAIAAISAVVACATQPEDDDDTVAAISAAVACIMEETAPGIEYAITSIRRSADARPVWGFAGMQQNTRPF